MRRTLLLTALLATHAAAQEQPTAWPTRDVEVTYRAGPPPSGTGAILQFRMAYLAAEEWLRVDPLPNGPSGPSPAYQLRRRGSPVMDVVVPGRGAVAETGVTLDTPGQIAAAAAAGTLRRMGTARVLGLECTTYALPEPGGTFCLTAEGVVLQGSHPQYGPLEAVSVSFAPQDPSRFRVPAEYRRVTMTELLAGAVPPAPRRE